MTKSNICRSDKYGDDLVKHNCISMLGSWGASCEDQVVQIMCQTPEFQVQDHPFIFNYNTVVGGYVRHHLLSCNRDDEPIVVGDGKLR